MVYGIYIIQSKHTYNTCNILNIDTSNIFLTIYIAVQDIAHNTTTFFTGSNIGVGGIIIQSSDGAHADTKLTFTGGGMTTGVGLTAGVFYEFSLKKLTMRNNSNAKAKVFWTNSNPGTKLSDTNNAG